MSSTQAKEPSLSVYKDDLLITTITLVHMADGCVSESDLETVALFPSWNNSDKLCVHGQGKNLASEEEIPWTQRMELGP